MEMKTKLLTIVSILALFGPTIGSAGVDNWFGVDIHTYAYTSEDGNTAESYSTATNSGGDYTHVASESSSGNDASSNSNANNGDYVSSTSGANVQNSADTHAAGGSSATGDQTGAGVVSTAVSGIDFNYAGVDTSAFGVGDADAHAWAHAWS